ncbi:hypothetical protein [Flavivirga spongiicola]|uniref:Uncharacterized protein n=1 Tax=Flavivirga spongiicola TaxID=421621 RepID=A0ABU7Y0M9_9FLAO|nr:hypothetical protein [Flavivirga sp. MEBiC05379]MDO5980791.1 hypothetical protein [Flavivirga sp. MEBiC05379]
MKTLFLTLIIYITYTNTTYAQINKSAHYEAILQTTIDTLIVKETNNIATKLKLKDYQIKKLQSAVILYYINLRKISNKRDDNLISVSNRNLKWNHAEYEYLHNIKAFLNTEQEKIFTTNIYTLKTDRLCKRVFKKHMLIDKEENLIALSSGG